MGPGMVTWAWSPLTETVAPSTPVTVAVAGSTSAPAGSLE